ncbi:YesN/AraC family two-component response regulator [Neobacillus bataviensis]|uniref:YesN/AraC family two-component response regulator n=1 Tax=Neobacillus bataviensis TaxID=220685 RepID=A0A561CU85_9BACI|nr:helix-turn-helix domain-containing protein [Neobacillus bataviensis]TWD94577.1 YesN/AraC family two-component response regulator [Neobacillus bataviensis]
MKAVKPANLNNTDLDNQYFVVYSIEEGGRNVEGKWLIADRDLNEREGLKWLLKTSSIPVDNIFLASNFQEFIMLFEQKNPDIVLMELDMIANEEWSTFRELIQIYGPILLLTSAEATFEKARLAIDLQALDLMIKPFSTTKVKTAYQSAARRLGKNKHEHGSLHSNSNKDITYESLFISSYSTNSENLKLAAFQSENKDQVGTLYSFLAEYSFKDLHGVFALSDLVILLFKEKCLDLKEQCQKAIRKWEEDFSESLAIVIDTGKSLGLNLHEKYLQTRKMLEFTYYKGYRQVFEFDYSSDWAYIDPFLTPPEQRDWIDMLSNLQLDKIKKWLYDEFLQLKDPFPDPGLVRIRLTSILAQIRRFMRTYNLIEDEIYEWEYRDIFNSILYDAVLYRTVQNLILFIQKIVFGAEMNSRKYKQDPIERGISFLETNFAQVDLKLDDVAQFVDRNPSYFSHLLIAKTSKGFSEILSGIRMKEAKRLLTETSKPIKEISLLVGYQNANYFSRSFKEMNGVSPKEFRLTNTHQIKGEMTQSQD